MAIQSASKASDVRMIFLKDISYYFSKETVIQDGCEKRDFIISLFLIRKTYSPAAFKCLCVSV